MRQRVNKSKDDTSMREQRFKAWVLNRGAQCIDKKILIRKNSDIDIDIEIDRRSFE